MANIWPKSPECVFNYIQFGKMEINGLNHVSISPSG